MKRSELRKIIMEELAESSGFAVGGHHYNKLDKNVYIGEDGLLGPEEELIDWKMLRKIFTIGKQKGWLK